MVAMLSCYWPLIAQFTLVSTMVLLQMLGMDSQSGMHKDVSAPDFTHLPPTRALACCQLPQHLGNTKWQLALV